MGDRPAPTVPKRRGGRGSRALLLIAAVLCALTAALLFTGHRLWSGIAALAALLAAMMGAARARAASDRRGRLAELLVGRLHDASVLVPLAWVWRSASPGLAGLALVGLGCSYVSSYERARGRSLGYRAAEGAGYRAMLGAILAFALLTGWVRGSLWAFAALTGAALAVRAWNVVAQERRTGPRPAPGLSP